MANVDELSIQIEASSEDAAKAIDTLVKGLENLNTALGNLDTDKVSKFASAVSKLSSIGSSTNTTAKAIKDMADEIAGSFGIKTKKGIDDIVTSLQALYTTSRNLNLNDSLENQNAFENSRKSLQKAIEDNYRYVISVDERTKAIKEYVKAQNKSGSKIAMGDMAAEFGEDFENISKVLGKSFKNKLLDTEATSLQQFFQDMNDALNTSFKTGNDPELKQSIEDLVDILKNAEDEVYNFGTSVSKGMLTGEEAADKTYVVIDKLFSLIKEQDKYSASSGLSGLADVFDRIGNVHVPDMTGVADAVKAMSANPPVQTAKAVSDIGNAANVSSKEVDNFTEKLLPAVIDTENQIDNLYRKMMSMSSTEAVYDMLTQKFIEMKTQLMEMSGAIGGNKWATDSPVLALPEFEKQLPAVSQMLNKVNAKVEDVGTTALALPEQFKTSTDYINKCLSSIGEQKGMETVAQEAIKVQSAIEKALEAARRFRQVISDMESGKVAFNKDDYDAALMAYAKATEEIKKYKDELLGVEDKSKKAVSGDILSNIVALGDALKKVSDQFGSLADKGISIFKVLTKPLQMAANEYVEKFQGMGKTVQNFRKKFDAEMTKLSQFWKRTMKTFTFMLVRKAIDAIVKEVGTAIQSLAMYSNAMGTAFNTDLSNMVADFQYLGRSIVSIFAPLLNAVIPIIDAIVDRIAILLSYIGMLFAALGGSTSFTKAKKNVGNYAESLDSASKSAKNLTMGIDELNILSESSGGGSAKPYDGWEDAWEDVEIPQWIQDLGDWFKDLWDKFFSPLKEAWDRAKQYLIDGFKTMVNSLRKLLGDIGNDFLEMWNQEKTIRMFEQILKIVGDLFRVVRNLANAFDEAWNYNKTGLHILENLRDILAILVDHARNISYYMIGWAKDIDFKPLLTSFEQLTNSAKRLADFIGGVVEDIFVYGILKYINWMIYEGIPHLQKTIAGILDAFNFTKIRTELKPLIEAVEEAFQNIHTGVTNAIGNLGKEVARFANSSEFTKFLQTLTNLAKQITAARVEKVLTGLGKGILAIAKAVVKFVNSKLFQSFIEFIGNWIDTHSSDDIAGILTAIANAILAFKFVEFTASKLSGVFQFFSIITALKNLGTIARQLTGTATAMEALGNTAPAVGTLYNPLSKISGILPSFANGFSSIKSLGIKGIFEGITTSVNGFAASLSPLVVIIGSVATAFLEWKGVSDSVEKLVTGTGNLGLNIAELAGSVGIAAVAFTALLGFPAGLIATGVVGAIAAIKGIQTAIDEINFEHVTDAIMTQGDTTITQVRDWYSQSTEIVSEYTSKWKDIERTLTQDRGDIDEYAKSLSGLNAAIESNQQVTVGMANELVGKYEDLGKSITNYIDQSTNAIVESLLAQRAYLKAQGKSTKEIDNMIASVYKNAEAEKNAITGALDNLRNTYSEYEKAVQQFGADSDIAIQKYGEYVVAANEAGEAVKSYVSDVNSVDTSEAVKKITELGESLDLSNYTHNEEGLAQAKDDITTAIQEIQSTYETEMGNVNQTYSDKIAELDTYAKEHPWFTDDMYDEAKANIERETEEAKETLISSTTEALDFFSNNLTEDFAKVAQKASDDWDAMPWYEKLINGDKQAYILSQMQTYSDNLITGEGGLSGILSSAYKSVYQELPGQVSPDVESAMQSILENESTFFITNVDGTKTLMAAQNKSMLQGVLDVVDEIDFDTPATLYGQKSYNALNLALQGQDYQSLGYLWNNEAGGAVLNNSQIFEDSNRLAANDGAAAFSQEYRDFLADNQEIITALGETGGTYGSSIVEGLNAKIEEDAPTTEPILNTWFSNISKWIHDNPFMPFGSPNKKTQEYGKDTVDGFNLGITTNASTSITAIGTWFTYIDAAIKNKLTEVKATFNTMLTNIFSGAGWDYNSPITTLFTNVTMSITNNLTILGDNLLNNLLPMFMETYILPFFSIDRWQPLFDVLLNEVFMASFTQFTEWFNTSMTTWWNEYLLIWFQPAKWNSEVFLPLQKNREQRYKLFIDWWVKSLKSWWEEKTMPYFKPTFWDEKVYIPLQKNREKHYKEFIDWWDKSLKEWWDNKTMPYFKDSYWDDEIYTPIKDNLHKHFEAFIKWWDETLEDWWNNHTKPYFEEELWRKLFTTVLDVSEDVFEKVKDAIQERIKDAAESVASACDEMTSSLNDVLSLIGEVTEALKGFGDLGGAVTFNYSGEFAAGGFPSAGSLFLAGETGAGAEFVGNIGGRTGVVSNDEITGIADAVYSTGNQESVLLAQLISLAQALLDKDPVVIGDKEIAEMANNGQSQLGMSIIS